jgi:hypothetical protein
VQARVHALDDAGAVSSRRWKQQQKQKNRASASEAPGSIAAQDEQRGGDSGHISSLSPICSTHIYSKSTAGYIFGLGCRVPSTQKCITRCLCTGAARPWSRSASLSQQCCSQVAILFVILCVSVCLYV